jgi:hypothetical protein
VTPEQTLTAAAQKLRAAATNAQHVSPQPWTIGRESYDGAGVLYAATGVIVADRSCDDHDESVDLPYIALMHPGVGTALADWLDQAAASERAGEIAAARVYNTPDEQTAWRDDHRDHHALAVARQILGDQP